MKRIDDVTVLVITHNRRDELLRTLARLADLPERPPVVVVDNGSRDGTAAVVAEKYPSVKLWQLADNHGAVARNIAVERIRTRYVAFCDDDTWWEPGSLSRAARLLDAHPHVAAVTARILVEPGGREDPIVRELRDSPLPRPPGTPLPALGSFLAGATMMRVSAFRQAGGFSPRLWLGGEEELLSADLLAAGWHLCYAADLTVHHAPSPARDADGRRRLGIRNTLWFTWLRRPLGAALRRTAWLLRTVPRDRHSAAAVAAALAGLPWVLRERRVVPARVEAALRLLEREQRRSSARRYVSSTPPATSASRAPSAARSTPASRSAPVPSPPGTGSATSGRAVPRTAAGSRAPGSPASAPDAATSPAPDTAASDRAASE